MVTTYPGLRDRYHIPPHGEGQAIYFCGNSLGLQPKSATAALERELAIWRERGIDGFFTGDLPWLDYHAYLQPALAKVAGAQPAEVLVMNTLTVNLHLLMVSFYRPTSDRFKIVMEAGAFPSDQYAVASQVQFHGFDPETAIVEVRPREGEVLLRTEDIVATIEREGSEVALVLFGGLNYYTGQFYDLPAITRAGHAVGARVGFDLAHAIGNVPLRLHDWDADFAVWCSYKYLNSGPGGPSGLYIHERHGNNPELPRFAGWWGHDREARFLMRKGFQPMNGAAGWQVSTAQILPFAVHWAALRLFEEAGMDRLRQRSLELTAQLESIINAAIAEGLPLRILTPTDPTARGAQLSVYVDHGGKDLFDTLTQSGVICDWREDNLYGSEGGVIRIAPTPMYNTAEEIEQFGRLLIHYRITTSKH